MNFQFLILFYKRGLKAMFVTLLLNLFIMSLIGIINIGTVLPFNIYARNQLETIGADVSAVLQTGSMKDLSYTMINETFSSITFSDGDFEFAIIFPLKYSDGVESKEISFLALSKGLYSLLQLNYNETVGSEDLSMGLLNVTSEEEYLNFTLSITKIENLDFNTKVFHQLIFLIHSFYQPILFSPTVIGNLSLGEEIYHTLNLRSENLFAEGLFFFKDGWTSNLSFDEIESLITKQEKAIFQQLVKGGVKPELISFDSYAKNVLKSLSAKIQDQTLFIQTLSIPNFAIALILIFILEFGAYGLILKHGRILWSRGLSIFKLKILYWSLEILTDVLGLFIIQAIFSSIILLTGLQTYLHTYLFSTFSLLTVIFILAKIYRFITLDKGIFTFDISDERTIIKIKTVQRRINFRILRVIVYTLFAFVTLLQIFRIFEPLFWYPIFSGVLGKTGDYLTYTISFVVFFYLILSTRVILRESKNSLKLTELVRRLLKSGLKKLSIQRIVSTALFGLIIFLVIFETSYSNIKKNLYANENQLNDINIQDQLFRGFDINNVTKLKESIPQIKEIYPFQTGICSFITKKAFFDGQIIVLNGSKYNNIDLGWNHIIGSSSSKQINDILANFSQNVVIINQKAAEVTGFRTGETISFVVSLFLNSRLGYVKKEFENFTIVAVVDTLPFTSNFALSTPFLFMNMNHILEVMQLNGLKELISSFSVDIKFSGNETITEKQEKIETIIPLITHQLGVSSATLDIDSKYSSRTMEKDVAIPLFIAFNIVFAVLFLPSFIIAFGKSATNSVSPYLRQLLTRGFSIKKIKRIYTKELYSSLLTSILTGVFLGLATALTLLKKMNPWMLLATDSQLHTTLLTRLSIIVLGGIISSFITIPIVISPLKKITINFEKVKINHETNRN
ncbi:MAG: hypothetical protein ACTSUR_05830 [Candidatus Heimdallarchaeaceae archaeon]